MSPLKLLNIPSKRWRKATDISCISNYRCSQSHNFVSGRKIGTYVMLQLEDRNKTRTCHAVGSLQLAMHPEMWCYMSFGTQLHPLWPQTGDCLSAEQRPLYQFVKVRELALVWSGGLFSPTRFTVIKFWWNLYPDVKGLSHWIGPTYLHRWTGEAGLASGYWRAFLGVSCSSPDILTKHWALSSLY